MSKTSNISNINNINNVFKKSFKKTVKKAIKKVLKYVLGFFPWLFVRLFGWIFYDKKYFKSKWFTIEGMISPAWRWAARDMIYRVCTLSHLGLRFPVSPEMIGVGSNVHFDIDDLDLMNGRGSYFQTIDGSITIGKGTKISFNVGMITTNHNFNDLEHHQPGKDIIIGENCWIAMNVMILPGVVLGAHTIVGAGSVVTKSFEEGNCIIAGNPAKKIKDL